MPPRMTAPPLPGDGADPVLPVLPRAPGGWWEAHIGNLMDPQTARLSIRRSSRDACLLTASRRMAPGESVRLVAPGGQAETLDAAQVRAALDVGRMGA